MHRIFLVFLLILVITGVSLVMAPRSVSAAGVAAVTAGDAHTCALLYDSPQGIRGAVQCWGKNEAGQLGDGLGGPGAYSDMPANVCFFRLKGVCVRLTGAAAVAAGENHTCALVEVEAPAEDYRPRCWGLNSFGQLGDGSTTDRTMPVNVSGLASGVASVAGGFAHACALTSAGGVECWGLNATGQLGDGTTTQRETPVPVSGLSSGVIAIAAGGRHTCAVTSGGGVKCWGQNDAGQLGDGTTTERHTPVPVSGLSSGVIAIAAGSRHTCAVTSGGGVKCWGLNVEGQLGDGQACGAACYIPVDVPLLPSGVTAVAAGYEHTCALLSDAGLEVFDFDLCWGANDSGQVGDDSTTQRTTPSFVCSFYTSPNPPCQGVLSSVEALAAGGSHSCALTTQSLLCWGANDSGQVGVANHAYCMGFCTTPMPVYTDLDGDGAVDGYDVDDDSDGCADSRELGPNPEQGGLRNPKYFWDFFDTPDAGNERDGIVSVGDVFSVVARFGSAGSAGMSPLSLPDPPPAYHTAFDRTAPQPGDGPWHLGQPDGTVDVSDIFLMVNQFGHTCA